MMKRIVCRSSAACVFQCISLLVFIASHQHHYRPVTGEVVMVANLPSQSDSPNRQDYLYKDDPLDSELQLKKMISYVEPLMLIFNSNKLRTSRETRRRRPKLPTIQVQIVTAPNRRNGYGHDYEDEVDYTSYGDYPSASHSRYGGGGGEGYGYCEDKSSLEQLLPLLALLALSGLLLFLIAASTTTTTNNGKGTGRRRRSDDEQTDDIIDEYTNAKIGMDIFLTTDDWF